MAKIWFFMNCFQGFEDAFEVSTNYQQVETSGGDAETLVKMLHIWDGDHQVDLLQREVPHLDARGQEHAGFYQEPQGTVPAVSNKFHKEEGCQMSD